MALQAAALGPGLSSVLTVPTQGPCENADHYDAPMATRAGCIKAMSKEAIVPGVVGILKLCDAN